MSRKNDENITGKYSKIDVEVLSKNVMVRGVL
jgi:hypothetical protein